MDKELLNKEKQMRKGVIELCVLSIISEEEMYSTDIITRLKEEKFIVAEGTVYPLLTRLRKEGKLEYFWKESLSGPPRKYYRLTEKGFSFLHDLWAVWDKLVKAVNQTTRSLKNNNHNNE